jgi:hypothetical protein
VTSSAALLGLFDQSGQAGMNLSEGYNLVKFKDETSLWHQANTLDRLLIVERLSPRMRGFGFSPVGSVFLPENLELLPSRFARNQRDFRAKIIDKAASDAGFLSTSIDQLDLLTLPGSLVSDLGQNSWLSLFATVQSASPSLRLGIRHEGYLNDPSSDLIPNGWLVPKELRTLTLPISLTGTRLSMKSAWERLNLASVLGVEVHIVIQDSGEVSPGEVRQWLSLFMAHPSVVALIHEGPELPTSDSIWANFTIRQSKINLSQNTGTSGRLTLNAFRGDYEILAQIGNRQALRRITVEKNLTRLRITL